ncbi:prephenate dehydratase family protein [Mycobacterium kansasii 824]|nr:prephenate dehydratase family protein [Mycobacterium kansasii 824]
MVCIAYLGPEGTFTEAALLQITAAGLIPGREAELTDLAQRLPVESTPAALDAVRNGTADFACVPIENSIDGSLAPTLDSLAIGSPLQVFAETTLDVAFSIVVRPGRSAAEVRTLAAFPVAAAQVRQWLRAHLPGVEMCPAYSNADAARQVADGRVDAAVTSPLAAAHWELAPLADGVVDESSARTRFVLIGRPARPPARTGADRTSAVLRIDNVPGALVEALTEFGMRGIDLTRIESGPPAPNWAPTCSSWTASAISTTMPSPRHSRRCTVVVLMCDTWVPGRRDRRSACSRRHSTMHRSGWLGSGRASRTRAGSRGDERSSGAAAAWPVPRQRRAPARHSATGHGVDAPGTRTSPRVRARRPCPAGLACALGSGPCVGNGRGDCRRAGLVAAAARRHPRGPGGGAGESQRRRGRRRIQRHLRPLASR